MAIDDAIEDMKVPEKPKQPQSEITKLDHVPEKMLENAKKILGNALVNYYKGHMPGQTASFKMSQAYEKIIRQYGYDIILITPSINTTGAFLAGYFVLNNATDDFLRDVVRMILGEYALETDIKEYINSKKISDLFKAVPELNHMKNYFTLHDNTAKQDSLFTINPYLVVAGIKNKHKAFNTLVIESALRDNTIKLPGGYIYNTGFTKDMADNLLRDITPMTSDYLKIAETYNIKDVVATRQEFVKEIEIYMKKWFK